MNADSRYFDTYAAYREALLEALNRAQRSVILFDPDLRTTGLETPAGIASLERFLTEARREDSARLLVSAPAYLERECPRLLDLLLRFGPRIRARVATTNARGWTQPFLIVDDLHIVTRFHEDAARGKICLHDGRATAAALAQFETMWISAQSGPSGAPLGI